MSPRGETRSLANLISLLRCEWPSLPVPLAPHLKLAATQSGQLVVFGPRMLILPNHCVATTVLGVPPPGLKLASDAAAKLHTLAAYPKGMRQSFVRAKHLQSPQTTTRADAGSTVLADVVVGPEHEM